MNKDDMLIQRIRYLAGRGMSDREIAKDVGRSDSKVQLVRRMNQIAPGKSAGASQIELTEEDHARFLALNAAGQSDEYIARAFHHSREWVRQYRHRHAVVKAKRRATSGPRIHGLPFVPIEHRNIIELAPWPEGVRFNDPGDRPCYGKRMGPGMAETARTNGESMS